MPSQFPTLIHERVELSRQGKNKTVVCKMKSGWVVLGDDQRLKGYSLLLSDPVVDSLNAHEMPQRIQFLSDMTVVGDALTEVLNPSIINYSILGNTDRALHAHIHPRYNTESPEKRRTIPFIYNIDKMPCIPFDYERDKALIVAIRNSIIKRGGCN